MEIIVIKPKNKKEQEFTVDLVKKLNFSFELQEQKSTSAKTKAKSEKDVLIKYKNHPLAKDLKAGLREVKNHINGKKKLKKYHAV